MADKLNRREFMVTGTLAGFAAAAPSTTLAGTPGEPQTQAPTVMTPKGVKPVVIASANGANPRIKNGGTQVCVEKAFADITAGADVLDALIAGVNIVELDPADTSVGYGGLPNADGVVQLDASCMHGPKKRAGGVAALEGVRTPSLIAREVMNQTDHHLLVGKGAQDFARVLGYKVEDDLNTPRSRELWLEWKRRVDPTRYLDPKRRDQAAMDALVEMVRDGLIDEQHVFGTINCNGIGPTGDVCGTTTTSGLAWKIPGRVGDSPIIGAGLYVDGDVGAAGSTGRGEANLFGLCSFLIVEQMRQGKHPKDAGLEALKRIKSNTIEKRLRRSDGNPNFGINFYVLNVKGEHAGVSMYEGSNYAVCTENGPQTLPCEPLLKGRPTD